MQLHDHGGGSAQTSNPGCNYIFWVSRNFERLLSRLAYIGLPVLYPIEHPKLSDLGRKNLEGQQRVMENNDLLLPNMVILTVS